MEFELDRLLDHARRGDPQAWIALVGRLENLVYSVPSRFKLDPDDTADVFIETFSALHRNLDRLDSGHILPRWVARTAARESLRIRRFQTQVERFSLDEVLALEDAEAERAALQAEDAFQLEQAMDRLDEGCRSLLKALFIDDASHTEIAARLGKPLGSIAPNKTRCLEKLRRIMELDGFFG